MAEPHTLKEGDTVTHPQWPPGTTRKLTGKYVLGSRGGYTKSRYKVTPVANERYMQIDEPLPDRECSMDDFWAEIGLEKVG